MTRRKLTPIERETAAILEADIRVRLEGKPITGAALKEALIEAMRTFDRPAPKIIAERDPDDPTRINFLVPADWFATFMSRAAARPGRPP
jgi:hypothetical protein